MSIQTELVEDYARNTRLVHSHMAGLTHPDSLIQPGGTGNSLNWILGHLLLCRAEMLDLLGKPCPLSIESLARYDNGSLPVGPASTDIWKFEDLLASWDGVDAAFLQAIQSATDEEMQRTISTGAREIMLYRRLHFYFFHEAFHVGQFEVLRHLAGKTDKLI
ncbi:MAG TPA: DinB family protein [Anaerolineaceae bacterium]|nr:DinB family protein [Anaerolineaceae bacterium]